MSAIGGTAAAMVTLTHPERVLDAHCGLTKRGPAHYLALVAERMLPHVTGRPISFVRCPGGTAEACFYQKHLESALPTGIGSVTITEKHGTGDYLTLETAEGLIALARPGAPVATPLEWDEARPDLSPALFTVETLASRSARIANDPWAPCSPAGRPSAKPH